MHLDLRQHGEMWKDRQTHEFMLYSSDNHLVPRRNVYSIVYIVYNDVSTVLHYHLIMETGKMFSIIRFSSLF